MNDEPTKPRELPGHAVRAAIRRTVAVFREEDLTDRAAALTYYSVLSLFPALIALVSILGLVGSAESTTRMLQQIVGDLGPSSAVDALDGPIKQITANRSGAGLFLFVGLAAALFSASGYVGAFTRASNEIYGVSEGRPAWKLRPFQLLVTLGSILTVAVVLVALVLSGPVAEAVGSAAGLSDTFVSIYKVVKWPLLVMVVMALLAVLYYATPNVRHPHIRWVTPGSVAATLVWIVASAGFALYVTNFGSYDKTYGTLGGVVTFLVWLWITNIAVLGGVVLNSEIERSRELEAGLEGAEDELQLAARQEPE
jgi:membrane protein